MELKEKKIAVIMSVYAKDSSVFFEESVKSILSQTYSNFDFYIMCDGAVPIEIQQVMFKQSDSRVKVVNRDQNKGLAISLNELIEYALESYDYDYFARMDADDISMLKRFQIQLNYFTSNPDVDVLGASCEEVDENGDSLLVKYMAQTDKELKDNLIKKTPFVHPTVVFKAEVFKNGIRYPTDSHLSEDALLWILLASKGYKFANIKEPLLYFRMTAELLNRRSSFKKAWWELKARVLAMKQLGMFSVSNVIYTMLHFLLRVSPKWVIKWAYKNLR